MKLAVIGDPIEHSASPLLHRILMTEHAVEGTYEAIQVRAGECLRAVERLRAEGYRGLNVTTPLKEEAFAACEHRDEVARRAGSVNTILFEPNGPTLGCNTDGLGALQALTEALGENELPHGTRILLLGAGPTARACAYVFSRIGWARVFLWNRTPERARVLAERYVLNVWDGEPVEAALSALPPNAALDQGVRAALVAAPVIMDANYGPRASLAADLGRDVIDGLPMLRASARASFELFVDAEHRHP